MRRPQNQKPTRAAVLRSLRELGILFGKKPVPKKDNALREQGADEAGKPIREVPK